MASDQDHDAFLERFLPVQTTLRGYLLAVTRDPVATDDIFQEVALVLWRQFNSYDRALPFAAWAMGITKLQFLKHRQSHARSRLVLSEEAVATLADTAGTNADAEDLRRPHLATCLGKLLPAQRTMLSLRFEQKKPLAEIASQIQKSIAAVEMSMVRIRRELRTCVERSLATEKARSTR